MAAMFDATGMPRVADGLRLRRISASRRRRAITAALLTPRRPLRWYPPVTALAVLALILSGVGAHRAFGPRTVPLYAHGVAVHTDGRVVDLRPGTALVPGSRVIDEGADSAVVAARQRSWLSDGRVPAVPELAGSDLVEAALLDLRVLTDAHGVTVAGWTPAWRYVWPRDAAFVAAAFARTGHLPEAQALLNLLSEVQPADGVFQARYRPDGTVPDDRGPQVDGTGWALWGLGAVVTAQRDGADRRRLMERYRPLLDRSVSAITVLTADGRRLPPAGPDYWETPERSVTLATCAPLLAGLRQAGDLYAELGEQSAARAVHTTADRLQQVILDAFGPDRFPRRVGGLPFTVDLGVALLLPPFAGVDTPAVRTAWRKAPRYLSRPAGGLAPGGSWRRDGISWTPTTATWALTAACLDREQAVARLRWLDQHRTPTGALPEKVLADGSPAAVAPLAWSAAAVVLTVDALERGC